MKNRPVGAELFHAGEKYGRTDMTNLIIAFRNFANATKKIEYGLFVRCCSDPNIRATTVHWPSETATKYIGHLTEGSNRVGTEDSCLPGCHAVSTAKQ